MNTPVTLSELKPPLAAGARPKPIVPTDMDQVWRFAQIVAKSGIAPKDMQKAETITVAIMHGLEIGLTPLMALQRIAVINGRPAIWGDAAIGLVRASGLCEGITESVTGDGDHMVATCRAKRKGENEPTERMFSVDDAKRAGLWNKTGPWQQYPKRMLQMRARAFALRDLFADVLGGLYIAEELEGDELAPRPPRDVTPRPLPPSLPPRAALPQESPSEPAGAVVEAEASEAPPKAKRPLPPLAKPRKTVDDDGIPGFLDRTNGKPKADAAFDGAQWLRDLEGAASGCEDAASLFDVQEDVYKACLMKAAPADRKKAQSIMQEHFTRIEDRAVSDARREAVEDQGEPDVPASRPRKPVAPEKRLTQQVALTCKDPLFWKFLDVASEDEAAARVRHHCGVTSRSDIREGNPSGTQWKRLHAEFLVWRDHPQLPAPERE